MRRQSQADGGERRSGHNTRKGLAVKQLGLTPWWTGSAGLGVFPVVALALLLVGCGLAGDGVTATGGGGTGSGQLATNPSSIDFGDVAMGNSSSRTATISNTGNASLTVSQANVNGSGFGISGLSLPLTLAAGQSSGFTVTFAPSSNSTVSGSVSLVSNAANSPTSIALSGRGVQSSGGQLTPSPTSVSFGNVRVGTTSNRTVSLSNSGTASLTITQANVTGSGFSISGLTLPRTLTAGQSTSFTVTFAPTATGSATGSVSLISDASNSPTTISLSGTGTQGQLTTNPTSINFGNVTVGTTSSRSVSLSNSGTASLTITQGNVTGSGFGIGGISFPVTLAVGQSTTMTVIFAPSSSGSVSGSVSLVSNASNSPTTISLSGTGVQPSGGQLTPTPSSIDFGDVIIGATSSRTVSLSNSGTASLTISQANVTGSGFSISGLTLPRTLTPGQSTSFTVTFAPAATGSVTGTVSLISDATNSPTAVALAGNGIPATSHSVDLQWDASTSPSIAGYNVYRASQAGGPYVKLNASLILLISFTDSTVQGGQTYYYVATAVDTGGAESIFSNEVQAVIPFP